MKIFILVLLLAYSLPTYADKLIFLDTLDGQSKGNATGIRYDPGVAGQAATLEAAGSSIAYPVAAFSSRAGTIEFDFKLNKPLTPDHPGWTLFSDVGGGGSWPGAVNLHWREGQTRLEFGIFDGTTHHWCYSTTTDWTPGKWYRVAISYGPKGMSISVDGRVEGTNEYAGGLAGTAKHVGWEDPWWHTPPVTVDNFRSMARGAFGLDISSAVYSPNGDGLLDELQIDYGVDTSEKCVLEVQNEHGKTVATILDQVVEEGPHQIKWSEKLPDGKYSLVFSTAASGVKRSFTVDTRYRWKQPKAAFRNWLSIGMYYFWEDDATYINRFTSDPAKAQWYYEKTIADLGAHGVNTVILAWTPAEHHKYLLRAAQKAGIKVMVHLYTVNNVLSNPKLFSESNLFDVAAKAVKDLKDDPAVAGYYIIDEPANTPTMAQRILTMKQVLEAVDPEHPSLSCLLGGYESLLRTVDYQALIVDIYPVSPTFNGDWSGYISEVQRGRKNAGDRPLWVILQAFGKRNAWGIPTPEEIRAQVWLALAYGANGIHYFIYQSTTGYQGEWLIGLVGMDLKAADGRWQEVGDINKKLTRLAPVLQKLKPAEFELPPLAKPLLARPFVDSRGARYAVVVNSDAKASADFAWKLEGKDVLTGRNCADHYSLAAGDGMLLRLKR